MKKKNSTEQQSFDSPKASHKPWMSLKDQSHHYENVMGWLSPARIVIVAVIIAALIVGAFFALKGGAGLQNTSQGVAATVNGKQLGEKSVNDYIAKFRAANHLETDDAWGSWLAASGRTPEDVRNEVVDFYIDQMLFEQIANERGISVSSSEINDDLNQTKSEFGSDEAFQQALESNGYTEEEYRENVVRQALLQQKVQEAVEAELKGASSAEGEASGESSEAGDENAEASSQEQQGEATQQFQEWFNDYKSQQDIAKNAMPQNAPYNIDVSAYEQSSSASESQSQDATEQQEQATADQQGEK